MEEHRIIQAAKLEANQISTTPFATPVSSLPHPTPFSNFPSPTPLPHFPAPTPIKPYPVPLSIKPYPSPTPIEPHPKPYPKPYPTPIEPHSKPFSKPYPTSTPNSILPPYKSVSPTSLPVRFPSGRPAPVVSNAPVPFSFPDKRIARPLTVQRATSRGFAHDFFSTPRKTPIVHGYYFEQ